MCMSTYVRYIVHMFLLLLTQYDIAFFILCCTRRCLSCQMECTRMWYIDFFVNRIRNGLSLLLSSKSFRRRHHGQEYKPFQFKFHILSGHRPELSEGTHVQWKFQILSGHRPELHLIVLSITSSHHCHKVGFFLSYQPLASAAPWSVIAQQIYHSTLLAQQGMARLCVPVLLLGHHLHSHGQNEYYAPKCLNKSLAKALQMFE